MDGRESPRPPAAILVLRDIADWLLPQAPDSFQILQQPDRPRPDRHVSRHRTPHRSMPDRPPLPGPTLPDGIADLASPAAVKASSEPAAPESNDGTGRICRWEDSLARDPVLSALRPTRRDATAGASDYMASPNIAAAFHPVGPICSARRPGSSADFLTAVDTRWIGVGTHGSQPRRFTAALDRRCQHGPSAACSTGVGGLRYLPAVQRPYPDTFIKQMTLVQHGQHRVS
jgi:hypothetical protein